MPTYKRKQPKIRDLHDACVQVSSKIDGLVGSDGEYMLVTNADLTDQEIALIEQVLGYEIEKVESLTELQKLRE